MSEREFITMCTKRFTRDFQEFMDGCGELTYHEIFELSQVALGHDIVRTVFSREDAYGNTQDIIIGYEPTETYLRLTPKQALYFPKWIEEHLMNDMDADSWYGFQYAIDHDND